MRRFGESEMKLQAVCLLLISLASRASSALFDGCDYTYNLNPGTSYLESPYYPNSYPPSTSCRYQFVAPLDYYITADCTVNLAKNPDSCSTEFFYVATDGDKLLRGSEQFCGQGTFQRQSLFRKLTLAYASYGSTGNFKCKLSVAPQPCDCGWSVNTKIVNGVETQVNEFPSMVALKDKTSSQPAFCAGSIISHYHILTAAHCTRYQPVASNILALVGEHDLSSSTETPYAAAYAISKIIEHPLYTSDPVNNDIALTVTDIPIEWSRGVGASCLPPQSSASTSFAYNNVDLPGWGATRFAGPTSNVLRKITLLVADNVSCQKAYDGITTISSSQLCTYDSTGSSKDTCQYDSGGPVLLRKSRQFLLGCISFGKYCGADSYTMSVNTRITSYLTWIYEQIGYMTCQVSMS